MSDFNRLKRVIKSWTGGLKSHREHDWHNDDPKMILNELGMQMSPKTLEYLLSTDLLVQDFLDQIYQTEEDLDLDLVSDNTQIDPRLQPTVYEVDGKAVFTITWKGDEVIFAEFTLPWMEQPTPKEEKETGDSGTFTVEIE